MKTVACLAVGAALLGAAGASRAAPRPNLLFIYTDDQRYDALSVVQREQGEQGRFPWFQTPHMDRLAAEGVRFRNAFVVNSLCAPSRAVNLTGRYNHLNGIASNFRPFPAENVTHASLLRAAGYTTAYIGKWHMGSQRERPGFDHHATYIGHARYPDAEFVVDGRDVKTTGWIDDVATDYAIDFLRKQTGAAKPWLMVVGFKTPHGPFEPPARARNRFEGQLARPVPNLRTPVPYGGEAARRRAGGAVEDPAAGVPVNLNYFRCLSAADECLGRLLDALDASGAASNTVVIYTSDNGFYLGEHGLGDKRSAYDESLRVPFLVRDPTLGAAGRGRVVDAMVLNLDLAQTLLDYAGVPAPPSMQGRSWRPLLSDPAREWRRSWFYEYFAERQKNSRVPDITAVRTADAKLIVYPDRPDWTELFDLAADPFETRNLFADPAAGALRARLEAEHARLLQEVGYCVPAYTDRPEWWGKPGGPDWQPENRVETRFALDGASLDGARAVDRSGKNNHGKASGVARAEGRDGRPALRFAGDGAIEVPRSPSLDPSQQGWTVAATFLAEKPDGVLLARGGQSAGYLLWLKEGRPHFTVNAGDKPVTVAGKRPVDGWTTVQGVIAPSREVRLVVNGAPAGAARLEALIARDPNDAMQVGADAGSPVVTPAPPRFTGLIEAASVSSGDALGAPDARK